MSKLNLSLAFLLVGLLASAQQNFSASVYTGLLIPYTDFEQRDYIGAKPNLAVGAGLGYNIEESIRLRGDLLFGQMNGNNDKFYHETVILEPSLGLDVNLLGLFTDFDGIRLKVMGGAGMCYYYARLYSLEGKNLLQESPVRSKRSMSPNAFVSFGGQLGIMLTQKLELNIGYNHRHLFDTPYLDGLKSGNSTDYYGMASVGMNFYLKSDRTPNTIEVKEEEHARAIRRSDSLGVLEKKYQETNEELAEKEMQIEEQKIKIHSLSAERDSLKQGYQAGTSTGRTQSNTTTPASGEKGSTPAGQSSSEGYSYTSRNTGSNAGVKKMRYRVIIASLPSAKMAQRWIDKQQGIDKSEIEIMYIESLDTYRVIYKSFDSYRQARQSQQEVKNQISDAWIIKL